MDLLDEGMLTACRTGQCVAKVRMRHKLALAETRTTIVAKAIDAGDVLRGAGKDQNRVATKR